MTLASARVQSFLNVQIVVLMAKQSARMITPVINSLIKIIIKVKTKIDAMAVVLWRMLTAAIYTQKENALGESKSEDSLESKLWLLMEVYYH